MKKRVLVVSSANVDLSLRMEKMPRGGETIRGEDKGYTFTPGGKGGNSAVAIASLGGECVFCASLGDDRYYNTLRSLYEKNGINTRYLRACPSESTGFAVVMRERGGQNRIIVYPGANLLLSKDDVREAMDCEPDALYMQLEISPEIVIYAANEAARRGIPVFIDAGPADPSFPLSSLPELEVFSPNESETEIFTGISPTDEQKCLEAVDKLKKLVRAKFYVLKLGSRGAFISDGVIYKHVESYPVTAIDTTAAGDAFTAALTLRYLDDGDITSSTEYACAVGAITVSRRGASSSVPSALEVEKFLEERGEYII